MRHCKGHSNRQGRVTYDPRCQQCRVEHQEPSSAYGTPAATSSASSTGSKQPIYLRSNVERDAREDEALQAALATSGRRNGAAADGARDRREQRRNLLLAEQIAIHESLMASQGRPLDSGTSTTTTVIYHHRPPYHHPHHHGPPPNGWPPGHPPPGSPGAFYGPPPPAAGHYHLYPPPGPGGPPPEYRGFYPMPPAGGNYPGYPGAGVPPAAYPPWVPPLDAYANSTTAGVPPLDAHANSTTAGVPPLDAHANSATGVATGEKTPAETDDGTVKNLDDTDDATIILFGDSTTPAAAAATPTSAMRRPFEGPRVLCESNPRISVPDPDERTSPGLKIVYNENEDQRQLRLTLEQERKRAKDLEDRVHWLNEALKRKEREDENRAHLESPAKGVEQQRSRQQQQERHVTRDAASKDDTTNMTTKKIDNATTEEGKEAAETGAAPVDL